MKNEWYLKLHLFLRSTSHSFRKVGEENKKGIALGCAIPYISICNNSNISHLVSVPQTRTLTGLSYTPLLFCECKDRAFVGIHQLFRAFFLVD